MSNGYCCAEKLTIVVKDLIFVLLCYLASLIFKHALLKIVQEFYFNDAVITFIELVRLQVTATMTLKSYN